MIQEKHARTLKRPIFGKTAFAMKRYILAALMMLAGLAAAAQTYTVTFGKGQLVLKPMDDNAVRVRYVEGEMNALPEWIYLENERDVKCREITKKGRTELKLKNMSICIDPSALLLEAYDAEGRKVFAATTHELEAASVQGEPTRRATLVMDSPADEHLYGLGQFQDGYLDVRGLTRRLTQVNSQIAVPFLLSSKGYGLLWNNYGITDFNPTDCSTVLTRGGGDGRKETVNVTSTEGGREEVRENNRFSGTLTVSEDGKYTILLDVGQKMARRHHLTIDGQTVLDARNVWLPPTASTIVELKAGEHRLEAELERGDEPSVHWGRIVDRTVLRSDVAECVDYTIFTGSADEIIGSYRRLTGEVPMLPKWAFGYIHCRERYHSQDELLANARRFREERIPIDLIVQDWQYWGKYGWNAMRFDEEHYPDPAQMVRELHDMDMKLMLSVWSKIDPNSEVGREAQQKGHFIPNTTWLDFFDEDAAAFYQDNFTRRLIRPYGIDAWWLDATEPENDDLEGRRIIKGTQPGERFRNIYPLQVSKAAHEMLKRELPDSRAMIFTRCGFPGMQRYGSVFWSGDVGNDWTTLRNQIAAGLGLVSTGLPWWTYDAGGFFRPYDQYTNAEYIERMIRWIQAGIFLPLMRVHGYMSNTEPWNYGPEAQRIITGCINLRYRLLPYIYSEAAKVSLEGSTLMRPFVFDFPDDEEALRQQHSFMLGESLLVCPVTEPGVSQWKVYLPEHEAGWYDFATGERYEGGQYIEIPVTIESIPVFAKGGSIIPLAAELQHSGELQSITADGKINESQITLKVFPGADAAFVLYEDDGVSCAYENGQYRTVTIRWDERRQKLECLSL